MELWVILSFLAAAAQAVRFMLQKTLAVRGLSATGATFARFAYSAPLMIAGLGAVLLATGTEMPALGGSFWAYALTGGLAQVLATICVVALFKSRNFAVGLTFAKTEVLITAAVGALVLGDAISIGAGAAMVVGALGVVLLSRQAGLQGLSGWGGRATVLGVASGALFAVSAVSYRGASLEIASDISALRAAVTLACVTGSQMIGMALWLIMRNPGQIGAVWRARRTALVLGLASLAGSFGWFWAFTLQNAAYVKAVGQIELVFGLVIGVLVFGERPTARELVGMALLSASVVGLLLLG